MLFLSQGNTSLIILVKIILSWLFQKIKGWCWFCCRYSINLNKDMWAQAFLHWRNLIIATDFLLVMLTVMHPSAGWYGLVGSQVSMNLSILLRLSSWCNVPYINIFIFWSFSFMWDVSNESFFYYNYVCACVQRQRQMINPWKCLHHKEHENKLGPVVDRREGLTPLMEPNYLLPQGDWQSLGPLFMYIRSL